MIFSDHNALKLDINCKKKAERTTNRWRLNNMLLKNNLVREETKREIKVYIETNDNDSTTSKLLAHEKSAHKRKVHIITGLSPKTRTSPNKQPNSSS